MLSNFGSMAGRYATPVVVPPAVAILGTGRVRQDVLAVDNRVELLVPVERPELRAELEDTLERCFADDTNAWTLDADGNWRRRSGRTRSVHRELMELTLAQAAPGGVS